jgi:hypothetical protein
MEGLDPTSEHLGGLGNRRYIPDRDSRVRTCLAEAEVANIYSLNLHTSFSDLLGGTTGSKKSETKFLQPFGKGKQSGLVVDRQQG